MQTCLCLGFCKFALSLRCVLETAGMFAAVSEIPGNTGVRNAANEGKPCFTHAAMGSETRSQSLQFLDKGTEGLHASWK